MICAVRRGDPPLTITWFKDGSPLAQDLPQGLTLRPLDQFSSALILPHALAHHSGNYSCQAANAARTATQSATLVIKGECVFCLLLIFFFFFVLEYSTVRSHTHTHTRTRTPTQTRTQSYAHNTNTEEL